jgi:SOS-response transcriptional repressor LexA
MTPDYQQKLLSFYESHRRMPTYAEMMKLFGFKSKNAVYRVVTKLIAAGIVTKDRLGKLIPSDSFGEMPMVGYVTAGLPAPVEVQTDPSSNSGQATLNIEDYLVRKKSNSYLFEVQGDSMIDAHIADGDMVIAERTTVAKDGDIIIQADLPGIRTQHCGYCARGNAQILILFTYYRFVHFYTKSIPALSASRMTIL